MPPPLPLETPLLLVKPPVGLSTPAIFKALDLSSTSKIDPRELLQHMTTAGRLTQEMCVNDLEQPAFDRSACMGPCVFLLLVCSSMASSCMLLQTCKLRQHWSCDLPTLIAMVTSTSALHSAACVAVVHVRHEAHGKSTVYTAGCRSCRSSRQACRPKVMAGFRQCS